MLLPGVNHVFKQAPADPTANAATYSDPDLPLAPRGSRPLSRTSSSRIQSPDTATTLGKFVPSVEWGLSPVRWAVRRA